MKKMKIAAAILAAFIATGCANTDIFSGDVYSADQAKEARSVSYGTILSVRPVKIQADNQGIIGTVGGGGNSFDSVRGVRGVDTGAEAGR